MIFAYVQYIYIIYYIYIYITIAERLLLMLGMPRVGACFVSLSDHEYSPPQAISKPAGREEDQSIYLQALAKDFNMFLVGLNAAPGGISFLEAS